MKWLTLLAKNSDASNTPTNTPKARLCVQTTTITVLIMTTLVESGYFFRLRMDCQSNVPIETIIITATSAAMGMRATQSLRKTTRTNKTDPATRVDRRPRPPDLTLITDWPIMAHPAMPPRSPEPILAMPCPLHSRFLSL